MSASIERRIKALEKQVGTRRARRAFSFEQGLIAAERRRAGMSPEKARELMGPPAVTLKPGEKSANQWVLETGVRKNWSEERKRLVDNLERERLESLHR